MDYSTLFRLDGKVAIVTGAGRGLGRTLAEGLATFGARIVVAELDSERGEQAARELTDQGYTAIALSADVTSRASVEALVQRTLDAFGGVDILINNAGITINHATVDFPEEDFDRIVAVNLKGVFLCGQAVGRAMVRAGRGGRIVNIASVTGAVAEHPRTTPYSATKAGVIQMTKSWALEWASNGINVNAIGPGLMRTEMTAPHLANPELMATYKPKILLGRPAETWEMVGAAVYLCAPASSYVTGQTIFVEGGWLAV